MGEQVLTEEYAYFAEIRAELLKEQEGKYALSDILPAISTGLPVSAT